VRRAAVLTAAAAAVLLSAPTASAALQPVRRDFGELTVPRVRAGALRVPARQGRDDVRVIVTLPLPPLAAAFSRTLALRESARRRLDAHSAFARAYLAQLDIRQRSAAVALRRAIPEARIGARYRVVLDGFTVSLPPGRLPRLAQLGFVAHLYPSLRFTESLNRSPALIGAPQLAAATGARGEGVKIGVVDDGIDQTSSFFNPDGFAYPAGFPKGDTAFTTAKVIAARAFPGPSSGAQGRLPLDRKSSFHGTHVAGIAAGDAGTAVGSGPDHPALAGLSGVAPRAWLGNYRVFNIPTPQGYQVAETPEVVAAFEAAVQDGMDVINFSGGGPQTDPARDAMSETVRNVATAGAIPVIAAGNDRDDFGLGSIGSPGSIPESITVAAVSNAHVFGRALTLVSPTGLPQLPVQPGRRRLPEEWASTAQKLVDVGTIRGTDGRPVDPLLCGRRANPNAGPATLPRGSLAGAVALVSRGRCAFTSKAQRVRTAGGVGMIAVDNRPGEANPVEAETAVPSGMVSDLDGARLRSALAASGGRGTFRIGRVQAEILTGRGETPTSFSAGGPTAFDHLLKPDISAPGGQVLSSTLTEFAGAPFAVFDGTSMATPHIAGAAALLRQRHPTWTPAQVKSALMATAAPAFGDTARTEEASVLLEGAGLADLVDADDPRVFTAPQSLSFGYLDVTDGRVSRSSTVTVADAGGGAGTWEVEVAPQSAVAGASLSAPPSVSVPAGGAGTLAVTAGAAAGAAPGDAYGFLVLRRGTVVRRLPYAFFVTRPALSGARVVQLRPSQSGDTRGRGRASAYRWPAAPFGPPPDYVGRPVSEIGAEHVYAVDLKSGLVNAGVVALTAANVSVDPWFLGSLDENDVQGYAGTPLNVNALMSDYRSPVGAAGTVYPTAGRYYVSVDSGRDEFTGRSRAGRYALRFWVNDVTPPRVELVTKTVAAGRPVLVLRARDAGSGVDPLSITLDYAESTVGATDFDRATGIAVLPLPESVPTLASGTRSLTFAASDYQEAKNVNTIGANVLPNTKFLRARLRVVQGPVIDWLLPVASACARGPVSLAAVANDTNEISSVAFYEGKRRIARLAGKGAGLYTASWSARGAAKGRHVLEAVLTDGGGREARARRIVRIC
jgi:subtilisin family serine protease